MTEQGPFAAIAPTWALTRRARHSVSRNAGWLPVAVALACGSNPDLPDDLDCRRIPDLEEDATRLASRFARTYHVFADEHLLRERCPDPSLAVMVFTVTSLSSDEELALKPCGAAYLPVSVEVFSALDGSTIRFDGWLTERGEVFSEEHTLHLSDAVTTLGTPAVVIGFDDIAILRASEAVCEEAPADAGPP